MIMKRLCRIFKIRKAGKLPLCKRISKYGYILREFYAPLPKWQIEHNAALDREISEAEREHQEYLKECEEKRQQFIKENPDNPYGHLFYMPVKSKRQVIGIRYVQ